MRQRGTRCKKQGRVGAHARGDEPRVGVAVERLAAENELRLAEAVLAGKADVNDGTRPPLGEHTRGCSGRIDRADTACECIGDPDELAFSGGNHQHVETVVV